MEVLYLHAPVYNKSWYHSLSYFFVYLYDMEIGGHAKMQKCEKFSFKM